MTTYQYDYLLWLQAKRDFPDIDHRHQEPEHEWQAYNLQWAQKIKVDREIAQQREQITREFRRGE